MTYNVFGGMFKLYSAIRVPQPQLMVEQQILRSADFFTRNLLTYSTVTIYVTQLLKTTLKV